MILELAQVLNAFILKMDWQLCLIGWGWNIVFLGPKRIVLKSSLGQHAYIERVDLYTKECASEMTKQTL